MSNFALGNWLFVCLIWALLFWCCAYEDVLRKSARRWHRTLWRRR